jgi:hypothetical protein
MIRRIINLDVFRFSFGVELNSCMYYFLIIIRKLPSDGRINLIRISSESHNVGITMMKDGFDYLLYNIVLLLFQIFWF